jgi:hypothetical protein
VFVSSFGVEYQAYRDFQSPKEHYGCLSVTQSLDKCGRREKVGRRLLTLKLDREFQHGR